MLTGIVVSVSVTALMLLAHRAPLPPLPHAGYRPHHAYDEGERTTDMQFVRNIPFFSIMLCMVSVISSAMLPGRVAKWVTAGLAAAVAAR